MASATPASTQRPIPTYEDDRERRRDVACTAAGLVTGAGVGLIIGAFAGPSSLFLAVLGAVLGGIIGRLSALRISADDWDPHASDQPYVGASSPDDDIT